MKNIKRLLVDGAHPEEIRVASVAEDNRITEYKAEYAGKEMIKGNIYVGRVAQIEPSLQAAFVEYGDNKQGFLPFSEISVHCFNIPEEEKASIIKKAIDKKLKRKEEGVENEPVNEKNTEEADEQYNTRYNYKIEDVIKKNDLFLVQVTKDERSSKAAVLTTFVSLAGKYSVLIPNGIFTSGISKKITKISERQKLKKIISDLREKGEYNLIIRTAGQHKTPEQILEDYEQLQSLWKNIEDILKSSKQPTLVYKEDTLAKKIIRELFSGNVQEVVIEGANFHSLVVNYAKLTAPNIIRKIKLFRENSVSLFAHYGIETEVSIIHSTTVPLKSGGYLIINPTEAMISIDVNSGKSIKTKSIEETAFQTNLEASVEIPRQLKLRNLSGLIVVDFIDMKNEDNKTKIEESFKEEVKKDSTRTQVGSVSQFGLLELSRQRIDNSLTEKVMEPCGKCCGTGYTKPLNARVLQILRGLQIELENFAQNNNTDMITIALGHAEAFELLNKKRRFINQLEDVLNCTIYFETEENLDYPYYQVKRTKNNTGNSKKPALLFNKDELKLMESYKSRSSKGNTQAKSHKKIKRNNNRNNRNKPRVVPKKKTFLQKLFGV